MASSTTGSRPVSAWARTRRDIRVVQVLFLILSVASAALLWPFFSYLALAAWFAHLAEPAQRKISKLLWGKNAGAAVVTLGLFVAVVAPMLAVTISLVADGVALAKQLMASTSGRDALSSLVSSGGDGATTDLLHMDVSGWIGMLREHGERTFAIGFTVIDATLQLGLGLFIFFTAAYVFLVDAKRMGAWFERNSPIPIEHLTRLRDAFHETGRGLIVGVGLTGLAQGVVAAIAMMALGVPRALVLGVLTFFGSFIPSVGTALVWLPVSIGLVLTGKTTEGIVMFGIGAIVISGVDNVLRPALARWGKLEMHPFVLLLAMLGGIVVLGPDGLLIGPIVVRLAMETLRIARDEKDRTDQRKVPPPAHEAVCASAMATSPRLEGLTGEPKAL